MTVALGREQIEEILPHRDPFLFLDEVTVLEPGSRVVARKQVREDECRLVSKARKEIWAVLSYSPVLDAHGKPEKIVAFATDVTASKRRLADELVPLLEQALVSVPRPLVVSSVRDILVGRGPDQPAHDTLACVLANRYLDAVLHDTAGEPYTVLGYGGKQVRDNLHSADLVRAFAAYHEKPRPAAVYNMGGGRSSNCSMLEAIALCEQIAGRELDWSLSDEARMGDHRWWISDVGEFTRDYPGWAVKYDVEAVLRDIHDANVEQWSLAA